MVGATAPGGPRDTNFNLYVLGHGNQTVELVDYPEKALDFQKPEHQLRRVTLKTVEDIRNGYVGTAFGDGQVWTAAYLTDRNGIRFSNKPDDIFVQLIVSVDGGDGRPLEALFPTLNLDQLADKYSTVQPADLRRPEESHEKIFENLRFVSRREGEMPVYHYWVVPERGDKETPNLNPVDVDMSDDEAFQEEVLTQQQLDARAIDENAANRRHNALRERSEMLKACPDRRVHPTRCFNDQSTSKMENHIDPRSPEFEEQLNYYSDALQNIADNVSIYDWMNEEFSKPRFFLLDYSIHPGLQKIQAEQTKQYRELLRAEAFRQLKSNAVLKLTMAYFGLPVQPLTRKDLKEARKGEHPKTGLRDANAFDEDGDDEAEDGIYGSKIIWYSEKPLEFLDTYHERNLGYPMLRRKLNPHYRPAPAVVEQPVQLKGGEPILRLRGGGDESAPRAKRNIVVWCNGTKRTLPNDYLSLRGVISGLLDRSEDDDSTFLIDIIPAESFDTNQDETEEIKRDPAVFKFQFRMSTFTKEEFDRDIRIPKGCGRKYICRIRDPTITWDKYAALMSPDDEFSGDLIKLVDVNTKSQSFFETHDLMGAGNASSYHTQLEFKEALAKLICPEPTAGKDFSWKCNGQSGFFRADQWNCLTPQLRKTLWGLKSKAGDQLVQTLEISKVEIDSTKYARILVPGFPGLYHYPCLVDYDQVPRQVVAALDDKIKSQTENLKGYRFWDSFQEWDELDQGLFCSAQKDAKLNGSVFNGYTGTVVAKPEFDCFTLRDAGTLSDAPNADSPKSTKKVHWAPKSPSPAFTDFWEKVEILFDDPPDYVMIKRLHDETISEPMTKEYSQIRWKLLVFDALDDSNIFVEAGYNNPPPEKTVEAMPQRQVKFKVETTTEVPQKGEWSNAATNSKTSHVPKASNTPKTFNYSKKFVPPPPVVQKHPAPTKLPPAPRKLPQKLTPGPATTKGKQIPGPSTTFKPPQISQIRNTIHDPVPAGPSDVDHKYRAWNKHMAAEQAAADLKHKSWTEPLSVTLPGQAPKPQIFGPAKEAMIHGGRAVPILYHHDVFKTPTQIQEMEQELYRSRYDILQRKEMCTICNYAFEPGPLHDKERAEHIMEHQQALKSAGSCPICDLKEYQFMTREQKRQHIEAFHVKNVLPTAAHNQSFLASRPPLDPKEVCYCFRCGSYIGALSQEKKAAHEKLCKATPPSTKAGVGRSRPREDNKSRSREDEEREFETRFPEKFVLMGELVDVQQMYQELLQKCRDDEVERSRTAGRPAQNPKGTKKGFQADYPYQYAAMQDMAEKLAEPTPKNKGSLTYQKCAFCKQNLCDLLHAEDSQAVADHGARHVFQHLASAYEVSLGKVFSRIEQSIKDYHARQNQLNTIQQLETRILGLEKELENVQASLEKELDAHGKDKARYDKVILRLKGNISSLEKDLEMERAKSNDEARIDQVAQQLQDKISRLEHELEDERARYFDIAKPDEEVKELRVFLRGAGEENRIKAERYQEELSTKNRELFEVNEKLATAQGDLYYWRHGRDTPEVAKNCPLCKHVYEDNNNHSRYQHFYDRHVFEHEIPDPVIVDPNDEKAPTTNEEQKSVYADLNESISSWQRKLEDQRLPFWIKCDYPSQTPCTHRWNSNSYKKVEDLRKDMQDHQQEHVSDSGTAVERLEDAEPDRWACKICLRERGYWSDEPGDWWDKNLHNQLRWKHAIDEHIAKVHADIRDRIVSPWNLLIAKQSYDIKEKHNEVWDWGYLKRKFEKYETKVREERGLTFWSVEPHAKELGVENARKAGGKRYLEPPRNGGDHGGENARKGGDKRYLEPPRNGGDPGGVDNDAGNDGDDGGSGDDGENGGDRGDHFSFEITDSNPSSEPQGDGESGEDESGEDDTPDESEELESIGELQEVDSEVGSEPAEQEAFGARDEVTDSGLVAETEIRGENEKDTHAAEVESETFPLGQEETDAQPNPQPGDQPDHRSVDPNDIENDQATFEPSRPTFTASGENSTIPAHVYYPIMRDHGYRRTPELSQSDTSLDYPASWVCDICDEKISPQESDDYLRNYIGRIVAHYQAKHKRVTPYRHGCHLCSDFVYESPEEFNRDELMNHYKDAHPETIHLGPPTKPAKWYCPVCLECLDEYSHFERLEHLRKCNPRYVSETNMVPMTDMEAKFLTGDQVTVTDLQQDTKTIEDPTPSPPSHLPSGTTPKTILPLPPPSNPSTTTPNPRPTNPTPPSPHLHPQQLHSKTKIPTPEPSISIRQVTDIPPTTAEAQQLSLLEALEYRVRGPKGRQPKPSGRGISSGILSSMEMRMPDDEEEERYEEEVGEERGKGRKRRHVDVPWEERRKSKKR